MRKTRIFYPGSININDTLTLPANASHHLIRVLRYKKDTAITVFNGQGGEYSAILLNENPKATQLSLRRYTDIHRESQLTTILLQGVSRGDHMDTTIQKATELGASEIVPIICERSVNINKTRINKKLDRWHQILISACEQCGRNLLPRLHEISTLEAVLESASGATRLMLDPAAAGGVNSIAPHQDTVCILCGPEGGLTEREIDAAEKAGYIGIAFGPRVLRTETAGPAFISALQTLWGDMG